MGKYTVLAQNIVDNVGGPENINHVHNCMTRLRFDLKDDSLANDTYFDDHPELIGAVKSGGQYQVVVGSHVPDVYTDVATVIGSRGVSEGPEVITQTKRKPLETFQKFIQGVMLPTIGIMTAAGILQGLLALFSTTGILSPESGLYQILNAVGQAFFYFFPIFLGFNAAKALGMNQFIGAAIGASLLYPAIQNMEGGSLFGISLAGISYSTTVIPIILICLLAAPIERFLNRVLPAIIKGFITPLIVMAIVVPIGYAIIGPLANTLSNALGDAVEWISEVNLPLAGFLLGGLWLVLVVFGIHHAVFFVLLVDLLAGNPTQLLGATVNTSWAILAIMLVIWFKTRDMKLKGIAFPAAISALFGITEPAIYGILLSRLKFFVIACLSGAIGGLMLGLLGVTVYQPGGLGVFGPPSLIPPGAGLGHNLLMWVLATAIMMAVAAILTWIFWRDPVTVPVAEESKAEKHHLKAIKEERKAEKHYERAVTEGSAIGDPPLIAMTGIGTTPVSGSLQPLITPVAAPLTGQVIPLSEVADPAFSSAAMGDGVAIIPTEGRLVAPFDGEVAAIFPTGHAVGLRHASGGEVLMHIGLDTVNLDGKYFNAKVEAGQHVKAGDTLVEFDIPAIKAAGYDVTTPVIVTNGDELPHISNLASGNIVAGQPLYKAHN